MRKNSDTQWLFFKIERNIEKKITKKYLNEIALNNKSQAN